MLAVAVGTVGVATTVMLAGVVVCTPVEVLTMMGVVTDPVVADAVVTLAGAAVRAHVVVWTGGRR